METTADDASRRLLGAAGIAPHEVPPRPMGADWFREQPPWLAVTTVADRFVREPALDVGPTLAVAEELLDDNHPDHEVAKLVEIGLIEAMICSASHLDATAGDHIVASSPRRVWSTWHRRRERLEALSELGLASDRAPRVLATDDDGPSAMLTRCTTYRAESGRYVVLRDLISADRPSPWVLRHPVLTGLVFAAVMSVLLALSLLRSL